MCKTFSALLDRLVVELGHPDRCDLFKRQMGPLLRQYSASCDQWSAHSHQAAAFTTLIKAVSFPVASTYLHAELERKEVCFDRREALRRVCSPSRW